MFRPCFCLLATGNRVEIIQIIVSQLLLFKKAEDIHTWHDFHEPKDGAESFFMKKEKPKVIKLVDRRRSDEKRVLYLLLPCNAGWLRIAFHSKKSFQVRYISWWSVGYPINCVPSVGKAKRLLMGLLWAHFTQKLLNFAFNQQKIWIFLQIRIYLLQNCQKNSKYSDENKKNKRYYLTNQVV